MRRQFLFIILTLSFVLHANSQNLEIAVKSKLPGSDYSVKDFIIINNDTAYRKFEKKLQVVKGADTVIFIEIFDAKKYWLIKRFELSDGEISVGGWQQEFDIGGYKLYDRWVNVETGKFTGSRKYSYFPNGQTMAVIAMTKNKLEGNSLFYHNNGQLKHNLEYKEGRLWNVLAYYDQNGNPLDAGDFCDGTGTGYVYSATGKLIKINFYQNGKNKKSRFVTRTE